MGLEEQVKGVRLSPEEQQFLSSTGQSFSGFVKKKIQEDQKKTKTLSKKDKVNKVITNGIWVCIGMLFFMMLGSQSSDLGVLVVGGFGSLFTILGAVNLYLTMREDGFFARKK